MANYKLTQDAELDLDAIYEYGINTYGLAKARVFYQSLIDRFELIAKMPNSFPKALHNYEYRHSVLFPYSIYFKIINSQNTIEIIRILRSQDPEALT